MNRRIVVVLLLLAAISSLFAQDDWTIVVTGNGIGEITRMEIEDSFHHRRHNSVLELERKGSVSEYRGLPLRDLVAMVDGPDTQHPYVFSETLWNDGYDITLVAADGYAATFSTLDVPSDALIIAIEKDGKAINPMIVGDVPGSLWVKDLVAVELGIGDVADEPVFHLVFEADGFSDEFTIDQLETSEYYREGEGSYTTSAGSTYSHVYGGVSFTEMLARYTRIEPDTVITAVASDGYEMSYSGEQLLSEDGEWILAFKQDGEYLPYDPGFVRTVKIGANIDGHLSARMIERIVVEGVTFKPFTLEISGLANATLDRQTIQSGVSCHRYQVAYLDKKTGEVSTYEGIPLWRLMAYSDDPDYAPHKQDSKIISYNAEAAEKGYGVTIVAADGFSRTLDSRELHMNDDVILALYKDGEELPAREQPLILVWDKDASVIPDRITAIRNVVRIELDVGDS